MTLSRTEAMEVACPYCKALSGEQCIGRRGLRLACHRERHQAAKQAKGWFARLKAQIGRRNTETAPEGGSASTIFPTKKVM